MKKTVLHSTLIDFFEIITQMDFRKVLIAIWVLLFWLLSSDANAQFCTMACNNSVNVSLGASCNSEIDYDMILEDPDNNATCFPNGPTAYEVTVMGQLQIPIATSPFVTSVNIGNTYTVKVEHLATGNSCWGAINVQDKLPPQLTCPMDISVTCTSSLDPSVTGTPTVVECSDYTLTNFDMSQGAACSNPIEIITRTWTAVDEYNNSRTCNQTISIQQPIIADVQFPVSLDGNTAPALNCLNPNTDPVNTGYPEINGKPIASGDACNMGITFNDQLIPVCEGTEKIIRTWTVADWCSNLVRTETQIIKIADEEGPQLTCPADLTVSTNSSTECKASFFLPSVGATDNCSNTFTYTVSTPAGVLFSNGGGVDNVNIGNYTLVYTVRDGCNNPSTCQVNLTVEDGMAPSMICDQITTVTLNNNGIAYVPASVFDDGSYDNCCFDRFEVRRAAAGCDVGTTYGPTVKFCCEDIGQNTMVDLKGIDCYGNENSCTVSVILEDNLNPIIGCPADKTILCTEDYNDLSLTGEPFTLDGCGTANFTFTDAVDLNDCHVGTITRTFGVNDNYGNGNSCMQVITLIDNTPISVTFPPDYDAVGCISPAALHQDSLAAPYNYPVITGDECEQVAVNVNDEVFQVAAPACFKIVRTWTVINWCEYNPNSNSGNGVYTDQQILKITDDEAPVLTCPDDALVEILEADCTTTVNLPAATAEDCLPNVAITVTSDFGTGFGPFDDINIGTYNAVYTATDGCGNASSCQIQVSVVDGKKPTPYCKDGLIIEIMNTNPPMIDIWANDFDDGSFDNCGDVQISFSTDVDSTSHIYTCDDLGEQPIQMWVTDASGNQDFCETFIIIQDNMNHCASNSIAMVGGAIHNEMGFNVQDVTVSVNDGVTMPIVTDATGDYEFTDLLLGTDYTISPEKDMNPLNGVTTLDMVYIRRHILNSEPLSTPYKIIAADVNRSNSITTTDLVALRKLILFIDTEFQDNTSWRFVDANHTFQNPADPFSEVFPEVSNINNLDNDLLSVDFMAVKIGDVNNTSVANELLGADDRSEQAPLVLHTAHQTFEAGDQVEIPVTLQTARQIMGYQFTLNFDTEKLIFKDIKQGVLNNLSESNFGMTHLAEGKITTIWENTNQQTLSSDAILFSLIFEATATMELSESIAVSSDLTIAEAYGESGEAMEVQLQFSGEDDHGIRFSDAELRLLGTQPNPFSEVTTINFYVETPQNISLTVFSASGQVLMQQEQFFEKGKQQITLTEQDIQGLGVLLYTLKSTKITETGKMIRIK